MTETDPVANLMAIRGRIDQTMHGGVTRPQKQVSIIAVSKRQPVAKIDALLKAGHRIFGENRIQEAMEKWPGLKQRYSGIELHLVGPLQTNKVSEAVRLFDAIQSLDRPKLAARLAAELGKNGRKPTLFVQVNTGEEPQKSGVSPSEIGEFLTLCRDDHGLEISGLMCIPPVRDEPSPHFALLAKLADRHGLPLLSMGMSADFETAIQFGATHVRIGTALFGQRMS